MRHTRAHHLRYEKEYYVSQLKLCNLNPIKNINYNKFKAFQLYVSEAIEVTIQYSLNAK